MPTTKTEYSAEAYDELDIGDYRKKFPDETKDLSDEMLFSAVLSTEDDLDDDQWRDIFRAVAAISE